MNLKKLLIRLIILFLPFLFIIEGVFFIDPLLNKDIKTDYIASIIEKQELIKNTKSPKIVIIGGSGAAYGICSDSIEKITGIRTINQAIIFTFGPRFMMNQIEPYLQKGDIVVVSPEYMMDDYGDFTDQMKAARFMPEIKKHIEFESIFARFSAEIRFRINFFKLFMGSFKNNFSTNYQVNDSTSVFFRNAFDKNGNLISHLNNSKTEVVKIGLQKTENYFKIVEYFNKKEKHYQQKGIKLLFSFPAFYKEMNEEDKKNISDVERFINEKAIFKVIDSAKTNQFDESYFYDQIYHLNAKGRAIRSQILAKNIKKALN